jgi:hypothetical protein
MVAAWKAFPRCLPTRTLRLQAVGVREGSGCHAQRGERERGEVTWTQCMLLLLLLLLLLELEEEEEEVEEVVVLLRRVRMRCQMAGDGWAHA